MTKSTDANFPRTVKKSKGSKVVDDFSQARIPQTGFNIDQTEDLQASTDRAVYQKRD